MSELSDYKRLVEEPYKRTMEAKFTELKQALVDMTRLMQDFQLKHIEALGENARLQRRLDDVLAAKGGDVLRAYLNAKKAERAAMAQLTALTDRLQSIIDGNYPSAKKNDKCEHGRYGYEDCDECLTDAITVAIEAAKGVR